ncbi:hypothetical protein PMI07_006408 [Rhizobium sp. CF080]|nr:hypothetical protein PMI07_006408 [Rhizobium sp. CF080]
MESGKQHFYFFGKRIACAIYDPVTRELRLIYRSGRGRNYFNISPTQTLVFLSKSLKNLVPAWVPVFSQLSLC